MNPVPSPSRPEPHHGAYSKLLRDIGFQSFLWAQFLAAFNDNIYKMIVQVAAVAIAASQGGSSIYLTLVNVLFVIPFLIFAGPAGQIADRFSKTRVLQITKLFEIAVMMFGTLALLAHSMNMLLVVLFCMSTQANFASPAKYGIIPEIAGEEQLARANGLVELSTFAAILLGTGAGAVLFAHTKETPLYMGLTLLGLAVIGSLISLGITKAPASGSREGFFLNPFQEVWVGTLSLMRNRPLWLTVAGMTYFWFVGALMQNTVLLFRVETLHANDETAGFLVAALAAGIGAGSVLAGFLSGDRIELGIVLAGSVLMGLFAIAAGMTSSVPWALVWLTGLGLAGGLFIVPLNAYLQDRAQAQEKGRIITTSNFISMIGVLAAAGVLPLLHDVIGLSAARMLCVFGIFTWVVTIGAITLMPGIPVRLLLATVLRAMFRIGSAAEENRPEETGSQAPPTAP
jgi:acyl-[acyl-carrier-protein]-phospholipid O-acyltransferase / long-chain-fatty-acid--[acyl-carrier-protein] ligase